MKISIQKFPGLSCFFFLFKLSISLLWVEGLAIVSKLLLWTASRSLSQIVEFFNVRLPSTCDWAVYLGHWMQNNWSCHDDICGSHVKWKSDHPSKKIKTLVLLQESTISFTVNLTPVRCFCQNLDVSKRNSCRIPNYVSEVELGTKPRERGFLRVHL